ncbi:hypothetical protein BGX26_003957, partial [Mortierella sp. AD094]
QQCSRSGRLDGYCSEKRREQALSAASQSNDSENVSKTTKALNAFGIKKTADAKDVAASNAPKTKTTTAAKKVPRRKAIVKKLIIESSDEFQPDSEKDYRPSDSDSPDSNSDVDEDDEDDADVDELTEKLASAKIKLNTSTLLSAVGGSEPLKTKASLATSHPTVKIPESTLKILAFVKGNLKSQDNGGSNLVASTSGPHCTPEKLPSGLFKYHARVHGFLFAKKDKEKDDPTRSML